MEINLLGPLEVTRDGQDVTPSAPKLRRVLSLLVAHANKVVRTDQIVEELWEDNPPASVITTLQTYIYQLRKLLQLPTPDGPARPRETTAGPAVLQTSPNGYVLTIPPDALDALRFEHLAKRGRAELESGELPTAAATLSEALRLWRGPALVDVNPGPLLQAEVLRLQEMHKSAREQRIEADLQLGRHQEVLGELTHLATQEPTHEGFQAQLMLALYRSGRRSEALRVYQRTRTALATELGLDPSNDLQRLHRAILTADHSIDVPTQQQAEWGASGSTQLPRQLPPEGPRLVGRQPQVDVALDALINSRGNAAAVVAVVGPPGAGTSALCVNVAHLASENYPDGQFHARLLDERGRAVDPADVLAEFLRSTGLSDHRMPDSIGERCRLFRSWTADRRVLVTLDDVVDFDQLRPLLPSSGDCGVLVTSRRRLGSASVTATVGLCPLSVGDGVQLLTDVLGAGRLAGDESAAADLVRECDGLPANLHAAAEWLLRRPHWPVSRLMAKRSRSRVGRPGPASATGEVRASVERSYLLAAPHVRTAFRALTALENPEISLRAAASVLNVDEGTAESVLEDLAELHLVEAGIGENHCGYRFLPTFRAAAHQLHAGDERACYALPGSEVSRSSGSRGVRHAG